MPVLRPHRFSALEHSQADADVGYPLRVRASPVFRRILRRTRAPPFLAIGTEPVDAARFPAGYHRCLCFRRPGHTHDGHSRGTGRGVGALILLYLVAVDFIKIRFFAHFGF